MSATTTLPDARAALVILRDALRTALAGSYAAHYARYGGADAFAGEEEPGEPERAGRPYLLLAVRSDEYDPAWLCRRATLAVRATANDFNGGRTGAQNPVSSHCQLSTDLIDFIESSYGALQAAGLMDPCIDGPRQQTQQTAATGGGASGAGGGAGLPLYCGEHIVEFRYVRLTND